MNITPNFTLKEMLVGNEDYALTVEELQNLKLLCNRLQVLRDLYGPITVNSGLRSHAYNEEVQKRYNSNYVPNSSKSYHLKGMAADIVFKEYTPDRIQKMLFDWSGGLGSYSTFTHVDIGPKRRW